MPLLRRRSIRLTTIWLPEWARAAMLDAAADKEPDETGGILLGYEAPNDRAIVITEIVGAGPQARNSRDRFEPDGRWQEDEVARIYEESGRRTTYLGDWHSHPDGIPTPSREDDRTARTIGEHAPARMPHPVMIIVASNRKSWRIRAFRLSGKRLRLARLKLYPRL